MAGPRLSPASEAASRCFQQQNPLHVAARLCAAVSLIVCLGYPDVAAAQDVDEREADQARTWTVHAGAGSSKAWNFIGVTKEFPLSERTALFVTGGFGTILVGGGAVFYTNRDGNGLVASAAAGLAGAHVSLGGQLRIFRRGYLTAGGSAGSYFLQHRGALPYAAFEYRF